MARGIANGVSDLEIIDRSTLKKMEPNIEGAGAAFDIVAGQSSTPPPSNYLPARRWQRDEYF